LQWREEEKSVVVEVLYIVVDKNCAPLSFAYYIVNILG